MGFDIAVLRSLAAELAGGLTGQTIRQAGSRDGELGFACASDWHVAVVPGSRGYLARRAGALPASLDRRDGAERYLVGAVVQEVRAGRRDRVVMFRLVRTDRAGADSHGVLAVELLHPWIQCALVSERSGLVVGAWAVPGRGHRTRRLVVGQPYPPLTGPPRLVPGEDGDAALRAAAAGVELGLDQVLADRVAGVDRTTARELLHRAGLPPGLPARALEEADAARLWRLAAELASGPAITGGFVWRRGAATGFSALEPTHLTGAASACLPSISEAILRARAGSEPADPAADGLRRALTRLSRREQAMRSDLEAAQAAPALERQGAALLAHLDRVVPGAVAADLPDPYDPSGQATLRVELDPARTPAENANELLKRSRRYRRRLEVLPERLRQLRERIVKAEEYLRRAQGGETVDASEVRQFLGEPAGSREGGVGRPTQVQAHPRRYRTSDGWSVWAGRSNRENDYLTHRLTAQNDVWFHAHGYAGAHVVLRREGRREEPSARALEEAAGVAAYWSKGRTARKVPVVYTLAKFVTKPRGGEPGQALLRREKTLIVRPQLLPEESAAEP